MISSFEVRGVVVATFLLSLLMLVPMFAHAQLLSSDDAHAAGSAIGSDGAGAALNFAAPKISDQKCMPVFIDQCPCQPKFIPKKGCSGPFNNYKCPCMDPRGVTGICEANFECKATGFTNEKGGAGGAPGLDQVAKMLGDLMGKLMGGGKDSGGSPSTPTTPTGGTGCLGSYYQTSDVSKVSDPCARYTPSVSDDIDTGGSCSPLNESLGLCSNSNCPDVTIVTCAAGSHAVSGGSDANNCALSDKCVSDTTGTTTVPTKTSTTTGRVIFATTSAAVFLPPGGFRGDINARGSGATAFAGSRDTQGNVEVAGFFGSETFSGGSQGLIGSWCKSRPWASNFLGKIIAPDFFDNLCKSRGYQVGTPTTTPAVVLQQTKRPKATIVATTTVATSTYTGAPPKVDIWAVPASVPLGGRTSIFWNTQGVKDCTETSANGGFSQNSLSGGAATQPITAATTFSISCLSLADGSPVSASVTVNLKI